MIDLPLFFTPCTSVQYPKDSLGAKVVFDAQNTEEIERGSICIFHVKEYRGREDDSFYSTEGLPFRKHLYKLFPHAHWRLSMYDLGDLSAGETIQDTYFAVQTIITELIKKSCIPILVGGSLDLIYPLAIGYEPTEQLVNICSIDEQLNLGKPEEPLTSQSYLSALMLRRPCYLFNHSSIGIQPNANASEDLSIYEKLFFDVCRLGAFNSDFRLAEPYIRYADVLTMNLNSLKVAERMLTEGNPNGFTVEQFCRVAKYAGFSDKLSSFALLNPQLGMGIDASIAAQVIWYFLEGVEDRCGDFPVGSKKDYLRFTVILNNEFNEIVFYKSNKSERWWMEVPYPPTQNQQFERHHLVPCDKKDYVNAMNNELPDLWWRTYQKLG